MKNIRFLLCIFGVSLLFACSKTDALPEPSDGGSSVIYNINKATLLKLVNDVRASGCTCGSTAMPPVPALVWNDQLAAAAYDHSLDMQQKNYFSHTGSDGSDAGQRITSTGYKWTSYGENIARGQQSENAVMSAWLSSEGHCRNIMSARFREIGAGRSANYWTQVFGSR